MGIRFAIPLLLLAVAMVIALPQDRALPAATSRPPALRITGIVGASVDEQGFAVVVTSRDPDVNERKQFYQLRLGKDGALTETVPIGMDSASQFDHTVVSFGERFGLAWIDPGKGLLLATVQQGVAKVETVLPDDPKEGSMGDFWLIETKGQARLFVALYRHVDPNGQPFAAGSQYTWLYSYALEKDGPKLTRKTCVEDEKLHCVGMRCAASGNDIIVWQIVSEKGSAVQTVRCALWSDQGKLEWKDRYMGNEPLGLLVDTSCGSACLVQEWKSPEDASGILCCVRAAATEAVPVGAYGESSRQKFVRFSRLANLNSWAVASKGPRVVTVAVLDNDFAPGSTLRVDAEKVTDYVLATGPTGAYAILLQQGTLSCRKLAMESTRPQPSPATN